MGGRPPLRPRSPSSRGETRSPAAVKAKAGCPFHLAAGVCGTVTYTNRKSMKMVSPQSKSCLESSFWFSVFLSWCKKCELLFPAAYSVL